MFSRIRRRFTYANVAVTLALVFAMTGGAYAAKRYVITSTKQISPTVLKRLAGKGGPAGANGAQGPAGAKGENGAAGPEGKAGAPGNNGTGGESVVMKAEPKGTHCKEGGANFTVGGKIEYACNGSPWTAGGTLPKGATEKGAWAASGDASEEAGILSTGVSFNIPLATAPTAHYIVEGEELTTTGKQPSTICTGSPANPTAPEGALCVYASLNIGGSSEAELNEYLLKWKWGTSVTDYTSTEPSPNTAAPFGFSVVVLSGGQEFINYAGSWAVTG
jgi:hypothetical protein